jgi:hypothetical protein
MPTQIEYTSHMNTTEMTSTMTATLTAPAVRPMGEWFTALSADLQGDITEMVNDAGYPLLDIKDFIEAYGAEAYSDGHYVTWCELTEDGHDNDAIAAYIDEVGIDGIGSFEDAYRGEYDSEAEFAEQWFVDIYSFEAPDGIVVDWQATWDTNLQYDFAYNNGYIFSTQV